MTSMKAKTVSIYSAIHFLVDLACVILVSNLVYKEMGPGIGIVTAVILYNFFAFAMQLPLGIIADKLNRNALFSAAGCLFVALAYAFANSGIIACIIAGIGNSMFHIGGGIDVLNISGRKATPSGVFVATGAMGVFLGGKSASVGFDKFYIVIIVMIASAAALVWLYSQVKDKIRNEDFVIRRPDVRKIFAIICLVITVCVRSYVGMILAFEWKADIWLAVISILAVVFGKMLGGVIGDRIGFMKTSAISLVCSAVLFIFAFQSPVLGILAILLFNMTMPITLTALSNIMSNKGMAFGLLTFALFLGAVPTFIRMPNTLFTPAGLFGITFASAIILIIGIHLYNEITEKKP